MKNKETYSDQIEGWAAALRDIGQEDLASKLVKGTRERSIALTCLEEAGLPVYERTKVHLKKFLEDPNAVIKRFNHDSYYLMLSPKIPGMQRHSKTALSTLDDLLSFIRGRIKPDHKDVYDLILQEFEDNAYGGTIVSNEDLVHVEICEGKQSSVAKGNTDVITATKDNISFKYSTEDIQLREHMWRVLNHIRLPADERQTDMDFMKGYFEFALTRSPTRSDLRTVFFDYQISEVYTAL